MEGPCGDDCFLFFSDDAVPSEVLDLKKGGWNEGQARVIFARGIGYAALQCLQNLSGCRIHFVAGCEIKSVESSLLGFESVESSLQAEIKSVESSLRSEIKSVESSLEGRICFERTDGFLAIDHAGRLRVFRGLDCFGKFPLTA